jgi:truncated hemoglobin YjbI
MSDNPHYERLGGEATIRELVDRFYALMDGRDDTQPLRQMHAKLCASPARSSLCFSPAGLAGRRST